MNKRRVIEGQVIGSVGKLIPTADVFSFLERLTEAFKEQQFTEREMAAISARREVLVAEITRQYDLYQDLFDKIFAERKYAVDKHFEIVEKGIAANDKELIINGLRGVSTIVSSSPFANLQELAKVLDSGQRLEI